MLEPAPIGTYADNFFGGEPEFSVPSAARRKHMAIFGATGTGKSTLLANMAASDIATGAGVTVVDPHGGVFRDLLSNHIPRSRKNDVIVFDPSDREHPIALNVLDCPRREQRGLVVSHVMSIFYKLWSDSWGARMEHILRNSLWVLIEQPQPTSLLAISKLLTNPASRAEFLDRAGNDKAVDFFRNQFDRWPAAFREEAISPVLNKCDAFLTDPMMRAIIGQTRSTFNFRWMMDRRKVLLCNFAKGLIGDDNARLLGSLVILKEKLAALSREDTPEPERVPHAVYVEEAQSFLGDFESMFAETRKYSVPLTIATQGVESLSPRDAAAVFTNCGTVLTSRLSAPDALRVAQEFGPDVSSDVLQDLPDYTFYVQTLTQIGTVAGASPSAAHRVNAYAPFRPHEHHAYRESAIAVSRARYAKPRAIVEDQIRRQFFRDAKTA